MLLVCWALPLAKRHNVIIKRNVLRIVCFVFVVIGVRVYSEKGYLFALNACFLFCTKIVLYVQIVGNKGGVLCAVLRHLLSLLGGTNQTKVRVL